MTIWKVILINKFIDLTGQRFGRLTVSKYKGVSWNKKSQKWTAQITYNYTKGSFYFRKDIYLGCFTNEEGAALAYNQKAIELFGEFVFLNLFDEMIGRERIGTNRASICAEWEKKYGNNT